MLKDIDRDLNEWTEATLALQSGGLGFNRRTTIGRMIEEGGVPAGSQYGDHNPNFTIPRRLLPIDRVVRRLDKNWLRLLNAHYFEKSCPTRSSEKCRRYRELDRMHFYIAGCLAMMQ